MQVTEAVMAARSLRALHRWAEAALTTAYLVAVEVIR
jgi:hypothetical protein